MSREQLQQTDQLGAIFQVIGTPDPDEDLGFLQNEQSRDYVRSFPKIERVNLEEVYPGTDSRGLQLLQRMLAFNPNNRISAAEAILNDYFDDIRLPEQEDVPAPKFDLSIDDLESDNISIEQLRVEVTEMIKKLSSEHFNFQEEAFIQQSDLQ